MENPDLLRYQEQIRAEAALLRAVAREADTEVGEIVAAAREKRERLSRKRQGSRTTERAREPRSNR